MTASVAIIGLGIMGSRMLKHMRLHEDFNPDYLWDPCPTACENAKKIDSDSQIMKSANHAIENADFLIKNQNRKLRIARHQGRCQPTSTHKGRGTEDSAGGEHQKRESTQGWPSTKSTTPKTSSVSPGLQISTGIQPFEIECHLYHINSLSNSLKSHF